MQESSLLTQLRRGDNIQLDCSEKRYTDSITYKQEAFSQLNGGTEQVSNLHASSNKRP